MEKKLITQKPVEIPIPVRQPEIVPPIDPEEPFLPEVDPDHAPDENPFVIPPYEIPEPGEGP